MDEFGVLVESIGFKTGRSAPMADLKSKIINNGVNRSRSVYNSNSVHGLGGNFRSSSDRKAHNYGDFDVFDDVVGAPVKISKLSGGDGFNFDSMFEGSNYSSVKSSVYDDDIFGGMPGLNSSTTHNNDDLFGSMAFPLNQNAPVEDLLVNFGEMGLGSIGSTKKSGNVGRNGLEIEDLIPGFGGSRASTNRANEETSWSPLSSGHSAKPTSSLVNDPFLILEQSTSQVHASSTTDDLDSIYGMAAQQSGSKHNMAVDPVFDALFQPSGGSGVKPPSGTSTGTKKSPPTTNMVNDYPFFFGDGALSSEEFQEIEGESRERRRGRLNHHLRTQQRMATALAEKNRRDFQTQQDQEERHRIAETLDDGIKRWAAGKEGNLRALLSSLQNVLWPECGWQPVSLTDLITSVSVKKVYYKATLCVHPDKVQQKGASIQQKYTAEKVFDLLKEAYNKFNSEEL